MFDGWSKRWVSSSTGVAGSHHIFRHQALPELLNLQDVRGEAKPYQLRQLLAMIERYDLGLEWK